MTRVLRAWRRLAAEQRLAAIAAVGLFVTMFLPWYSRSAVGVDARGEPVSASQTLNAFQVFSFVEAAVLLVAVAVLWLLFARAEERAFHLPGGDGTIIALAGFWVCLLVFWRQFDQPDAEQVRGLVAETGVTWGIFVTFLVGAVLAYTGLRVRAAHRPEPPLPGEGPRPPEPPRAPRPPRRRVERPAYADVPQPSEPPTMRLPDDQAPTRPLPRDQAPTQAAPRRRDDDDGEQLSFDA